MAKIICKVCGKEMSGNQCEECGWVLVRLPQNAPSSLRDLYDRQTSKMKELRDKDVQNQQRIASLQNEIQQKRNEISGKEDELRKVRTDDAASRRKAEQLESANETQRREHDRELRQVRSENERLQREIERAAKDAAAAQRQLSGAQLRIEGNGGRFTLFDTSGQVRRSNGSLIGKSGIELYDGYVFSIGKAQFTVNVPDFDFDNLNL